MAFSFVFIVERKNNEHEVTIYEKNLISSCMFSRRANCGKYSGIRTWAAPFRRYSVPPAVYSMHSGRLRIDRPASA